MLSLHTLLFHLLLRNQKAKHVTFCQGLSSYSVVKSDGMQATGDISFQIEIVLEVKLTEMVLGPGILNHLNPYVRRMCHIHNLYLTRL